MVKTKSFVKDIKKYEIARLITAIIIFIISIIFLLFAADVFTTNIYVLIALVCIIVLLAVDEFIISLKIRSFEKQTLYNNLYLKTLNNFDNISKVNFTFEKYTELDKEFEQLNSLIKDIEDKYKDIIFYKKRIDFKDLKFFYQIYESQQSVILSKDSFIKNIPNFIDESYAFRNAFLIIRFSDSNVKLSLDESMCIVKQLKNAFNKNDVVVGYRDEFSLFFFIRNIDSIQSLSYLLNYFVKNYHHLEYSLNANECNTIKVSAVVYPYSSEKDIVNDLYYVNKKSNPIDIFIPSRLSDKKGLESQVERLSYLNKVNENMLSLGDHIQNETNFKDNFMPTLKGVLNYFDYNYCGFVINKYFVRYELYEEFSKKGDSLLKGANLNIDFINTIVDSVDKDKSVYFTSRDNVSPTLGKYLDIYHITSGYFYVIYLKNQVVGILYFVNNDLEVYTDFLDRELLFYYSVIFRSFYNELLLIEQTNDAVLTLKNLLKITLNQLYSINKDDYKLVSASDSLRSYRKDLKIGGYCYKEIYGLDNPCSDCPLKTNHNKESLFDKEKYISSLKLTNNKENAVTILMEPLKKDELIGRERYDVNLFINAYYPFLQSLNNHFDSKGKGYVVLCRIENGNDILAKVGEVNYNIMLRDAIRKISEVFNANEMYLYNSNTIGFIFNEVGLSTVYDNCELINHFIKHLYSIDGVEIRMIPSIFIMSYPLDFDNVPAFVRYIETNLSKYKPNLENKLYAIEQHVERFASKTDYTFSLLENAYKDKNFILDYLPVLNKDVKSLDAAIVSLEVRDDLRGTDINHDDLFAIITKENKMFTYTNLIIELISNSYNDYDPNAFRTSGLNHFVIRINSSFFNDPKYLEKLALTIQKAALPYGFILFMLDENDFAKNIDSLSKVPNDLNSLGIRLVLSKYNGEEVSLSKCNELGIHVLELRDDFIETLADNATNLALIQKIANEAKAYGIKIIAPSITSEDQMELLKETNINYVTGDLFEKSVNFIDLVKLLKNYTK